MFKKVSGNIYESDNGYVVEFKKVDGEKAAFVGEKRDDETIRLLFIISVEGITRKEAIAHLEENFETYLDKYVR